MMDWRLFASTFALIFLAELGDKTQLAALAASAGARSPWSVFAGASSALVVATLIATLVGSTLQRFLPAHYLKGGAAILFFLFGTVLLIGAFKSRGTFAAAVPLRVKPGVLTNIVLNAARDFEGASLTDYEKLARTHESGQAQKLFLHLAHEERQHLEAVGHLAREHGKTEWEGGSASTGPVAGPAPRLDASVEAAVAEALRHEQASARFYRELAASSTIPAVRSALSELARAEASHAAHLQRFLDTGSFGEQAV